MTDQTEFDCCILPGAPGWASCVLRIGDQRVEIDRFSHALTDGLDDLVRATVNLACEGWKVETFSIDDEPYPQWQWQLRRDIRGYGLQRRPVLDVTVTRIDDLETDGVVVLHATCDPDEFARAILSGLRRTMSSEPHDQLLKRWSRLPVRGLAALEAALAMPLDTVGH